MNVQKLSLTLVLALMLSACSSSNQSSSTQLSLSASSQNFVGVNGPTANIPITVSEPTTFALASAIGSSGQSVSNIHVDASSVPSSISITGYIDSNGVSHSSGCPSTALGQTCIVQVTGNNTGAAQQSYSFNVVADNTSSSSAVSFTLQWPVLTPSITSVSNSTEQTITVSNNSNIAVSGLSFSLPESSEAMTFLPASGSDACSSLSALGVGQSCTIGSITASQYTTSPLAFTIDSSNFENGSDGFAVSTQAPEVSISPDSTMSGSAITVLYSNINTSHIFTLTNDGGLAVSGTPEITNPLSVGFNYTTSGTGCSISAVDEPFLVEANGEPCDVTLSLNGSLSSSDFGQSATVTFGSANATLYNLTAINALDIVSEHHADGYLTYDKIVLSNQLGTGITVSNITPDSTSLPSTVSINAPDGQTANSCTGVTLSNGQSCSIWLQTTDASTPSSENGSFGISWQQSDTGSQSASLPVSVATYLYAANNPGPGQSSVVRWDGSDWGTVPGGTPPNTSISALSNNANGNLYAADTYGVYTFDSVQWQAVGTIETDPKNFSSLLIHDGTLYRGLSGYPGVQSWNGSAWTPDYDNTDLTGVSALSYYNNLLYAATGNIASSNNNGTTWATDNTVSSINSFTTTSSNIYAGGTNPGAQVYQLIGSTWTALSGSPGYVYALGSYTAGSSTYLFAGAGDISNSSLYRYDGSSWNGSIASNPSQNPPSGRLFSLILDNSGKLYAGFNNGVYLCATPLTTCTWSLLSGNDAPSSSVKALLIGSEITVVNPS